MTVRKLTKALLLIHGLQFLLGIWIMYGAWTNQFEYSGKLLLFGAGLMLLAGVSSIAGLTATFRLQKRYYRESMKNLEDLNSRLREQRHDYLNQMQIVYGLLELEAYEDAREYMKPVFKDIAKVSKALKTAQPAVNALLRAKMEAAEKQGIEFYLEVGSKLDNMEMEPWELCKALGNLIDNAMTAVEKLEGEKIISLEIREFTEGYEIAVRNNGPEISSENQKLIFRQGFTTKDGEGHGMGLAIVSRIMKEASGSVTVDSADGETVFYLVFPKKKTSVWKKKLAERRN